MYVYSWENHLFLWAISHGYVKWPTVALGFPRLPSRLRDFSEGSLAGEGCVGARAMKCPTAQNHQRLLLAMGRGIEKWGFLSATQVITSHFDGSPLVF